METNLFLKFDANNILTSNIVGFSFIVQIIEKPLFLSLICQIKRDSTSIPMYDETLKKRGVRSGIITVIHTFGRDLNFNPHVHDLVTEGALDNRNEWVSSR